jgi:hypothetical protein
MYAQNPQLFGGGLNNQTVKLTTHTLTSFCDEVKNGVGVPQPHMKMYWDLIHPRENFIIILHNISISCHTCYGSKYRATI